MGTRRHDKCQLSFLIRGGRYIFSHVILNDCCICMCLYVYVCVNFGDEILLKNVKPRKNRSFLKNGKTVNCHYSIG